MTNDKDNLIIRKEIYSNEDYMKTLKVSPELHNRVKSLADETNQPISKIACALIDFALSHVQIEE